MGPNSFFPGLAAVVRWAACWCSAFWLFTLSSSDGLQGIQFLPFLVGAVLSYLIIRLFLRSPHSVNALITLCVGLGVLLSGLLLWKFSFLVGLVPRLFCILAVGTTIYTAAATSLETPAAAKCITAMELTTLYFLVFSWAISRVELDPLYSLPLLTGLLLSMLVIPYQRLSNSSNAHGHHRGVVIVAAVLASILVLLVLFVAFGAAPLGKGIAMLVQILINGGKAVLSLVSRFLVWLISLLPHSDPGEMPDMEPLPQVGPLEAVEYTNSIFMTALIVLVCALALTGLFFLLRHFRKHRLGGKAQASADRETVQRQHIPLLRWLLRLLHHLADRVRLAAAILSMRGTPQELYYFLTRAARRLHCPRQPGETPAAFLLRMKALVPEDPSLQEALDQLVLALDQQLYARTAPDFPPETGRLIRREFQKLRPT